MVGVNSNKQMIKRTADIINLTRARERERRRRTIAPPQ